MWSHNVACRRKNSFNWRRRCRHSQYTSSNCCQLWQIILSSFPKWQDFINYIAVQVFKQLCCCSFCEFNTLRGGCFELHKPGFFGRLDCIFRRLLADVVGFRVVVLPLLTRCFLARRQLNQGTTAEYFLSVHCVHLLKDDHTQHQSKIASLWGQEEEQPSR